MVKKIFMNRWLKQPELEAEYGFSKLIDVWLEDDQLQEEII